MRLKNISVLTRREYLSRVKSKAFWLSTLLLPLFLVVVSVVPSLVMTKVRSSQRLALVDETGRLAPLVVERLGTDERSDIGRVGFEVETVAPGGDPAALAAELDRQVVDGEIDAWVWITEEGLAENRVEYHAASVSNIITQEVLERAVSGAARQNRLAAAGLDRDLIDELSRPVGLTTIRVSEEGSRAEAGLAGAALAYGLGLVLYMVLLIYGTQVMNGVIEEKSSRVVEVIMSTVAPFELMMGKLLGICLAVLTQLAIWMGTLAVLTAPGVVAAVAWLPEGVIPQLPPMMIVHFFLHFLLGYFVFATLYAAIGSMFNNVQEAQQFASIAAIMVIVPFLLIFAVINDPDSTLAVVTSLIPPFTPMLMMMRIAVKAPPAWQILLGYLLTTGFGLAMVWVAARIYRVGILMYGKKPSLKELWRWVRYA